MLPAVKTEDSLESHYLAYLSELKAGIFTGDIELGYSSRLAVATDNSVYQQLPQAVIFPKSVDDLSVIGRLASHHTEVSFSARGGGTGTNGQSLTSGIVVDISRHMNNILEIDQEEKWVKVQAGVVKDQLNDFLKPFGYFFAPDLSTSNRATIGGMINTDASGQGSLVYGKTSDHILGLTSVTADGTVLNTTPMLVAEAEQTSEVNSVKSRINEQLLASCKDKRKEIKAVFPRLNRFLTGYDLEHVISEDLSIFDASRVIAGSEGSLVFVAEAKLNITPIAEFKALINIKYDSFESALRHAPEMVAAQATSVETVDSKVLNLAKQDIVWHSVSELISEVPGHDIQGLNMVEYNSINHDEIKQKVDALEKHLTQAIDHGLSGVIGFQVTYDKSDILKIYGMRKKSVGLLGKTSGQKKPIAFAEDTAVPPENLADFIMDYRRLLDRHGLAYGMFGHVDAGVLHVRPALDMCDPVQEHLMHQVSDEVVELVKKYGGLMWGEHGKGYRSEYGPAFFGDELFGELRKIKSVFDPHNQMNPGKICTPLGSSASLVKVDGSKRGSYDRQIKIDVRESFSTAMNCNGNGLCFNYDTSSPMCPSSKVTQDRRHSPKGRATMIREWLRLLEKNKVDVNSIEASQRSFNWIVRAVNTFRKSHASDFSNEVLEVMDGCLACKACTSQCPINVDVPSFRARFLSVYYQRYLRPLKDVLVGNIEVMAPLMAKSPKLFNFFLKQKWVGSLLNKTIGYVDTPLLSHPTLEQRTSDQTDIGFDLKQLQAMTPSQRMKKVIVVQDPFTSFYEADVVSDLIELVRRLGYQPILLPFNPNGKPQHVKGFLKSFAKTARNGAQVLNAIHELNVPMIGVDPSLVLCYRDEYEKILGNDRGDFTVLLVHEWLQALPAISTKNVKASNNKYGLFAHCTEKTTLPASESQWVDIFTQFGLSLTPISVGCCGMAGTYGHESKNLEQSKQLYKMSWQAKVEDFEPHQILATGYSCRSQVKRLDGFKPNHPLQTLLNVLEES